MFNRILGFIIIISIIIHLITPQSIRILRSPSRITCGAKRAVKSIHRLINLPDHPERSYLNAIPWYKLDHRQQHRARVHAYLSMASYGDFRKDCQKTFGKGFEVLESFSTKIGQTGFTAYVPELEKIVIVFKGYGNYTYLDWDPASVSDLVTHCRDCKVAQGVRDLYLSAKTVTHDFAIAREAVKQTGLRLSVTGHGIGGSVAALAGLDLGARKLVHSSHNQGMPRSFNYDATIRYDNLFPILSGQSLVHSNDFMVQAIPLGAYYHLATKVHLRGPHQQHLINCYGNNENSTCTGDGSSEEDHKTYFTPIATCGRAF